MVLSGRGVPFATGKGPLSGMFHHEDGTIWLPVMGPFGLVPVA